MEIKKRLLSINNIAIVVAITLLPFLFYIYSLIDPSKENIHFFSFKISSFGFGNIQTLFYYVSLKLLIIGFLCIWLITCKHWWRIVILIPLTIEIAKLNSIFDMSYNFFEEIDYLKSLPFTLPIIFFTFYVIRKFIKYYKSKLLLVQIDNEIHSAEKKVNLERSRGLLILKHELKNLKASKNIMDKKEYLKELIRLKGLLSD